MYGLCNLLEEEMIVDELLLDCLGHTGQWVEGTGKITLEGVASSDDLVHDLISLLVGDTWAKRIASEVSSYSDSCGLDHGQFLLAEVSILESISSHVRLVLGIWAVAVIVEDNLIEKLVELGVSIVRSSIDTDSGVLVGNTGEDAGLEGDTLGACLVLVFFPDLLGNALLALGGGLGFKEFIVIDKILGFLVSHVVLVLWLLAGVGDALFGFAGSHM